jgi:hypothetical protein
MKTLLSLLKSLVLNPTPRRSERQVRLGFDALEDRRLMDAGLGDWPVKPAPVAYHQAEMLVGCALPVEWSATHPQVVRQAERAASQGLGRLSIGHTMLFETPENYKRFIRFLTVPQENRDNAIFKSGDMDAIKNAGLEDPLRRQIFEAKNNNTRSLFWFATKQHAMENFSMRVATIQFMLQVQTDPELDFAFLSPEQPPEADPVHWMQDEDAEDPWVWDSRPEFKSSLAIAALIANRFRGDCLGGIEIALLQAIDKTIGKARFNKMFPDGLQGIGLAGSDARPRSALRATIGFQLSSSGPITVADMIPGDWVYMKNKYDYNTDLKPGVAKGYWMGENTIYMGRYTVTGGDAHYDANAAPLFSGLGAYSQTETQLRNTLKDEYDKLMNPPNTYSSHARPTDAQVFWERIIRVGTGGKHQGHPAEVVTGP